MTMWARVDFKRASQRRFRTALSLNKVQLTQELNGVQQKTVSVMGATVAEYTAIVREFEEGEFLDEIQSSASEQIHFGIDCLSVECSGTRKLAPGVTDGAEYTYTPGECGQ